MNGLIGRTRRVLAGLVSAMMVLTSLPMTGVAVYAAPSDNAAYEDQAVTEDTVDETADAAVDEAVDEAAVVDEAVDAVDDAADDTADEVTEDTEAQAEEVTVFFHRGVSSDSVEQINIHNKGFLEFGEDKDTVSTNLTANEEVWFDVVPNQESTIPLFAYAGSDDLTVTRSDDEDYLNTFSFTPMAETHISVDARPVAISVDTPGMNMTDVSDAVSADGKYYANTESGFSFKLESTSDNVILIDDVALKAGEETLQVETDDAYVVPQTEVEKAVRADEDSIHITANPKTFEESRIHIEGNADVTVTPEEETRVSHNGIYYVRKGTGYSFTVDIKDGVENRRVYQVLCTEKSSTNDFVELENDGNKYTISENAIKAVLAGENDAEGFEISVVTVPASQDFTFKANEYVKKITYGEVGTEEEVDIDKAKSASGNTVSLNTSSFKANVTPSDNAILLSDSFKVDGEEVAADSPGVYSVDAINPSVDIEVTAYKKIGVSLNNLKSKDDTELTSIQILSGLPGGFVKGDNLEFKYGYGDGINGNGDDISDYDVTLAAPVVKYGDTVIRASVPDNGIEGTYTILKKDVEAAIRAGEDIVISAAGTEIPKAKITFKRSVSDGGVTIYAEEKNSAGSHWGYLPITRPWDVSGNTATLDLEVQAGNAVTITDMETDDNQGTAFFKVSKGEKEIEPGSQGEYNLGAIAEDAEVTIDVARLREDEISFKPGDAPNDVHAFMDISETIGDYINAAVGDIDLGLEIDNGDPIYDYKLKDVKYAVVGGSNGNLKKSVGSSGVRYSLPAKVVREAAFAKGVSGNKITVTAEFEKAGTKPQTLTMIAEGDADFDVVSNGISKTVDDDTVASYEDGYAKLDYDKAAAVTVTPKTGFALEKAYLISKADLDAASMNMVPAAAYVETLLQKVTASQNGIKATPFTPGRDGKIKVNITKVDGPYTIFVTMADKEELIIEEDSHDGWRAIPASDHTYNVSWGRQYRLYIQSGSDKVSLSKNSISVNYTDGKGGTVPPSVLTYPDEDPLTKVIFFNGEAVEGRTVMIKLGSVAPVFSVAKKPTDDSLKFADGVVSWNAALSRNEIIKAQPLGTSRTYRLTVGPEIAGLVGTNRSELLAAGVKVGLKDITDKNGNITGIDMTVTSKVVSPAPASVDIKFHDASTYPDVYVFKTVTVKFSTDQVTNADLSGVTATADTDSITVDFSKAKGFDKATDGLYYKVKISSNGVSDVLWDTMTEWVPASETSRTISMLKDPSNYDVEPNEITYIVKVELVQETDDHQTVASSGEKMVNDSVTTKSDGVYAKKIKLVKAKTAKKVIYGSSENSGMGELLLATVVYPDVAKNVPVTVKRLKELELTDSKGNDWSEKLDFDQNRIYLNPKSLPAGKYTLKAYAVEPKGVDVTGTLKFTVANAINDLDLSVPAYKLYKAPGKAASIKATVVYNQGVKSDAPKTKKVKWYLLDVGGEKITPPAGVTLKNGTVKIAKNAVLPENYTFGIYAEAADFDHGDDTVDASAYITVTSTPQVPSEIFIGDTQITEGAKLESSDLDGNVTVLDANDNAIYGFKTTVTGPLKADKTTNPWYWSAVNLGKASIKVTTADGSKKSKKIKFTVDTDEGINGDLEGFGFDSSLSKYDCTNTKDASEVLWLRVFGDDQGFVAHSIKLDGFKKVKVKGAEYGSYKLLPTKRSAKITIRETANSSNPTVINVTNTAIPEDSRAAATKITASNKMYTAAGGRLTDKKGTIFGNLDFDVAADYNLVSYNRVTYTVKYGNEAATAGDVVRLYSSNWVITAAIISSGGVLNGDGTYNMTLGDGGTFVIDYIDNDADLDFDGDGDSDLTPGTYKIQVTPVDDGGCAVGKAGTIKVKVVNAPKATTKTLKAKTVTFEGTASANAVADLSFAKQANILIGANGVSSAEFGVTIVDDESNPVDLDLRGLNVKGKINGFAQMFEVTDGGTLKYTGTKSSYYKNAKKGISGQIAVSYVTMDGKRTFMYVPITVKGNFR